MRKLFKEFKDFISRGNVLDLAVGMIIGAAFTAIITSIVNYVLKPLISLIPVGNDGTFKTVLREQVVEIQEGVEVITQAEVAIIWSEVISAIISFLATALVLFIIIKVINSARRAAEKAKADLEAKKAQEEAEAAPAEPEPEPVPPAPTQEELLAEILEELKKQNK